jgi:hypothetical protein
MHRWSFPSGFLFSLIFLLDGCAKPLPCEEASRVAERTDDGRIWSVRGDLLEASDTVSHCAPEFLFPIVLIDSESGDFLAMTQRGMRDKNRGGRGMRERRSYDDFRWRRSNRTRPRENCSPGDLRDVYEDNGIEQIKTRRIYANVEDNADDHLAFATRWLIRCLPESPPFVWLTPDGKVIGVYHSRRFQRFD